MGWETTQDLEESGRRNRWGAAATLRLIVGVNNYGGAAVTITSGPG